jgi:hypothetical protein
MDSMPATRRIGDERVHRRRLIFRNYPAAAST